MFAFFVALAIVVGLIEITVMIQVGQWLGVVNTIGLLLLVSVVGAFVVKYQGVGVLRRIQQQRLAGQVPAAPVFDGALILLAGLLLVIPGFVTDAVGLLLLIPPLRAGVRRFVRWRFMRRVEVVRVVSRRTDRPSYPSSRPPDPPSSIPPAQ